MKTKKNVKLFTERNKNVKQLTKMTAIMTITVLMEDIMIMMELESNLEKGPMGDTMIMVESILDTEQNVMVILEKQLNVKKSLIAIVNMLVSLTLTVTMSKFPDILKYLTKNATMLRFPIVTKFHRKNATPLLTNQERGTEAAVKVTIATTRISIEDRFCLGCYQLWNFKHSICHSVLRGF